MSAATCRTPPRTSTSPQGFPTREHQFRSECYPKDAPERIGAEKFPLWNALYDEFQAVDLIRQLEEGTPYPLKGMVAFGLNAKMLPQSERLLKAMADNLDFYVDTDIFMTMSAKYADLVLPACSSLERGEMKAYQGGFLTFTQPVIEPLYDSKSDTDIMYGMIKALKLDDELLQQGYEACCPTGSSTAAASRWRISRRAIFP